MYVVIGGIALAAGEGSDPTVLIASLGRTAWGQAGIGLLAVGLLSYGLWRMVEGVVDLEGHGTKTKAKVVRAGHLLSGAGHLGLGLYAVFIAFGGDRGGSHDSAEAAAEMALELPGGQIMLVAVSAALLAAGAYQLITGWRLDCLKFMRKEARDKAWVRWAARLGYAVRGLVFILIARLFWQAARADDAEKAGGLGDALRALSDTNLSVVAAGLVGFGIFCFVIARYHSITDAQLASRLKS